MQKWMKNHKAGESLKDRPKAGQPVVMTKILKIMVTKSLTQKSSQQESLSTHCKRSQSFRGHYPQIFGKNKLGA
jgi:hypothetical protein